MALTTRWTKHVRRRHLGHVLAGGCLAAKVQHHWITHGSASCPLVRTGLNLTTDSLVKCIALIQIHNFSESAIVSFDKDTGLCVAHDVRNEPDVQLTYKIEESDTAKWTKTLTFDEKGTVLSGSIPETIAKIRNGADMRIQIGDDMFYETWQATIRYTDGQPYICFRSALILSRSSWDTFDPEGTWDFTNACTYGKVYILQQHLGDTHIIGSKILSKTGTLFARDLSCGHSNPVYCNNENGEPTCPNKINLLRAIQQGAIVKIASPNQIVPLSRIEFGQMDSTIQVTGQMPWNPSLKLSPFDSFAEPSYWIFKLFSTTGQYVTTRYFIGKHKHLFYRESKFQYNWHVDRTWSVVYNTSGSTSLLKFNILSGRRISVMFDSFVMEADNVVITTDGRVIAQFLSQVDTSSQTYFTKGFWRWVTVSTDGNMEITRFEVGANTLIDKDQDTVSACWFAEKRVWKSVFINDFPNGTTGSLMNLTQAIRAGSRVRCVVKCIFESKEQILAVTADNIVISENGHVSVQVFRYIKLIVRAYWRFLLIKTTGTVTEFRWLAGEHTHLGTTDTATYIEWFVDQSIW